MIRYKINLTGYKVNFQLSDLVQVKIQLFDWVNAYWVWHCHPFPKGYCHFWCLDGWLDSRVKILKLVNTARDKTSVYMHNIASSYSHKCIINIRIRFQRKCIINIKIKFQHKCIIDIRIRFSDLVNCVKTTPNSFHKVFHCVVHV